MHFQNTTFTFLLFSMFSVQFVDVATSKNLQSKFNTFENTYLKILNENNPGNNIEHFTSEVEYIARNIMKKILPISVNISDEISITEICKSSLVKYVDALASVKGWALESKYYSLLLHFDGLNNLNVFV